MGLKLLAHFYERNAALIALGALEANGLVVFLENQAQISVTPFEEIARGGYRLMVPEQELDAAISAIDEAQRNRSFEGERLSQRTYIALSLFLLLTVFMFLPFRTSKWHDTSRD
jgi:hypothetical protein